MQEKDNPNRLLQNIKHNPFHFLYDDSLCDKLKASIKYVSSP